VFQNNYVPLSQAKMKKISMKKKDTYVPTVELDVMKTDKKVKIAKQVRYHSDTPP
jgi:hypothetical protein